MTYVSYLVLNYIIIFKTLHAFLEPVFECHRNLGKSGRQCGTCLHSFVPFDRQEFRPKTQNSIIQRIVENTARDFERVHAELYGDVEAGNP